MISTKGGSHLNAASSPHRKLVTCTAASIALLTIYDMLRAIARGMVIDGVKLLEKHGGKSGS